MYSANLERNDEDGANDDLKVHYKHADEKNRLKRGIGPLEFYRMKELMLRYLPPAPAKVCDIGGGAGEYSFWLAELGYEVYLVDIVPEHIEQAKQRASESKLGKVPVECIVGDALHLDYPEQFFDAVFIGGPLYHLTEDHERIGVFHEARRVLKEKGLFLAYGITRYASLMAGLLDGRIWREDFMEMLREEIPTGIHRRCDSNDKQGSLNLAYFHLPAQLRSEAEQAGLTVVDVLGVIGPVWMAEDFDHRWEDPKSRETLLELVRMTEHQPELGPRTMIVAVK